MICSDFAKTKRILYDVRVLIVSLPFSFTYLLQEQIKVRTC